MPEQVESKSGLPPKQRGHTVRIVDVAEVPIDFGLIENTLDGLKAHSNWDRKHNGAGLLAIEVSPEGGNRLSQRGDYSRWSTEDLDGNVPRPRDHLKLTI